MATEEKDTNIGQLIVNIYPRPGQTTEPPQLTYGAGYPYPQLQPPSYGYPQQQQTNELPHAGGGYGYGYPTPQQQQYEGFEYGYGYPPHGSAYYGHDGGGHKATAWIRNAARGLFHCFSCRRRRRHGHGYGYGDGHAPRQVEE